MDRFWIARDAHGLNKVTIPSVGDIDKYAKKESEPVQESAFDIERKKAEICDLVNRNYPTATHEEKIEIGKAMMDKTFSGMKLKDWKKIQRGL